METIQSTAMAPRILIADDDPCVSRAIADRCTKMGFDVEIANNGLQALIKLSERTPDILITDIHMPEVDGVSVLAYLRKIVKQSAHVMVITGNPGQEIVRMCDRLDVSCIHKGRNFWTELITAIAMLYPHRADAIRSAAGQAAEIKLKDRPRVLFVDDDIRVKKFLFHKFEKFGAELLYAADGLRGFWQARREQPSVIVSDYCMPGGGAEYLLAKLRSVPETSNIPVIIQSGRRLSDPVKQRLQQSICGRPGAARILRKTSDAAELFEAMQRFCGFTGGAPGREPLYR